MPHVSFSTHVTVNRCISWSISYRVSNRIPVVAPRAENTLPIELKLARYLNSFLHSMPLITIGVLN